MIAKKTRFFLRKFIVGRNYDIIMFKIFLYILEPRKWVFKYKPPSHCGRSKIKYKEVKGIFWVLVILSINIFPDLTPKTIGTPVPDVVYQWPSLLKGTQAPEGNIWLHMKQAWGPGWAWNTLWYLKLSKCLKTEGDVSKGHTEPHWQNLRYPNILQTSRR